ncbi:MAG TPA: apolipoprotein N-acyltransferase [Mycobacteriales bacterium]|nr:apolipoprotein N-acyltransferase [Mycobacteriales bacterium]
MHSTADPRPVETVDPPAPAARRRDVWVRLLAAAAAGGALVLAFPPYGVWPLAILSVAAFSLATRGVRARRGTWLGLVYGAAFFVPLLSWTGIYVGPAPWLILALAEAVFLAGLGATLAVTATLPAAPLWGAALWVAEEALRDRGPFGGFPWGRLAFAQEGSPFAWLAAYGGAPLVTFGVALAGTLLAALALALPRGAARVPAPADRMQGTAPVPAPADRMQGTARVPALTQRSRGGARAAVPVLAALVVLAGAVGAAAAAGDWQTAATRPYTVAVVQGNVPRLGLDFNAQREAVLRNHVTATLRLAADADAGRTARPDLVLWPENASDIDPILNPDARALIDQAARAVGVPILVGTLGDGPTADTIRNIAYVWDPRTGPGESYVKRHPVPFAEYIPLRRIARLVSKDVDLVQRDFVKGDHPGVLRVGPATVGDVICFEVAYDGLIRDVAGRSEMIVVQTNNATFGRSNETWQQLAMGRLRAIEHGRPVLVAATSGVSAVIDPSGHLQARSDVFTPDVLVRSVEGRQGSTLAGRVGAGPEWGIVAVALAGLVLSAAVRRRARDRMKENG